MVWPVSWPLPAMTSRSPGAELGDGAGGSPARRSPISSASGRAGQDLAADRRRILAARIVVGDDDAIGEPRGDLAHQRALAAVAIAAAAEDDDEPAAGMGAKRGQHRLQRVGLVGVVDIDRRAIGMLGHALDAARDAGEARHRGEHPVHRLAAGDGEAEGGQEIVGLEGAGDRKEQALAAAEGLDDEALALGLGLLLDQPQIAALPAEGDQAMAVLAVLAAASWANSGASG